jgi:hypothetical protein
VLKAAAAAGCVKRVVLTSSTSAVAEGFDHTEGPHSTADYIFTEEDWTNLDGCDPIQGAYNISKTLAERAAWDFVRGHEGLELTTMCCSFVVGPVLASSSRAVGTSLTAVFRLLDGSMPGVPHIRVRAGACVHVCVCVCVHSGRSFVLCCVCAHAHDMGVCPRTRAHVCAVSYACVSRALVPRPRPSRLCWFHCLAMFSCRVMKRAAPQFTVVDVRDAAIAHVTAMEHPAAKVRRGARAREGVRRISRGSASSLQTRPSGMTRTWRRLSRPRCQRCAPLWWCSVWRARGCGRD